MSGFSAKSAAAFGAFKSGIESTSQFIKEKNEIALNKSKGFVNKTLEPLSALSGKTTIKFSGGAIVSLAKSLIGLLVIIAFGMTLYLSYLMYVHYYPRPFAFGHSEPLEQFMETYIPELVHALQKVNEIDKNTVTDDVLKQKSSYIKSKCLISCNNEGDPESAPFLYLYFLLGKKPKKSVVRIANRIIPNCSVAETLADEIHENDTVPVPFIKDIEVVHTHIKDIRDKLKETLSSKDPKKIHHMRLALLLDKKQYIENIQKMYKFRITGGIENMALLEVTMMDYINYVWVPPKGVVPKVWMKFHLNIVEKAKLYQDWLASPEVSSFVARLPATIGGVEMEKFADKKLENFMLPPHTKEGDHIEHFGFLKGLAKLPSIFSALPTFITTALEFITTLMTVAQAMVSAIVNPIKALRLIIGMIAGVILVIVYYIMLALSFMMYGPAFVYVLFDSIFKTAWSILLFILQATFYMVLWVIDMITGGLILKIMRCENLPSKWFSQPGFFFDNKYTRSFMCNSTCAKRFVPSDGSSWCNRMRRGRPMYCPQQILYNAADVVINNQTSGNSITNAKENELLYKFVIPPAYYTSGEVKKKRMIAEYIKDKAAYNKDCFAFEKKYSDFGITVCKYFRQLADDAKTEESWAKMKVGEEATVIEDATMKKQVTHNAAIYREFKELIDKSLKLCVSSHCNAEYLKLQPEDASFCPVETAEIEEEADDGSEDKSMAHKAISSTLVLIVIVLSFITLYVHTKDKHFKF